MPKTCSRCRSLVTAKNVENAEGYSDPYKWEVGCDCLKLIVFGSIGTAFKKYDHEQLRREREANNLNR